MLKLRTFFQNRLPNDMFQKTQFRLTSLYSGLLILFLILFIVVVYFLLYSIILTIQKQDTEALAREEAKIVTEFLTNNQRIPMFRQIPEIVIAREDQFFYYVVNNNKELIIGDELIPDLRPKLVNFINNWNSIENKFLYKSVDIKIIKRNVTQPIEQNKKFLFKTEKRTIDLMITKQPLLYKGQVLGTIYVGKDISFFNQLLRMLLIIIVVISLLFFGIALYISHIMSKKAMAPISQAFTRQREFVADASHELRTPLSVLLSSINAIEMTGTIEPNSYPEKLIGNMKEEVKRMTKLVSDLLTLARSDSGMIELMNDTFDFKNHGEQALQSFQSLADSKQITLHFSASDPLVITGDLEKLKQLLYILLDNAIKYTPTGGDVFLTLTLEKREKRPFFIMEVTDTGNGINPEDQNHIFERFYRIDKARTRQMGGYGLGLAIAKWIVDIHSGTIEVSSELNKGSTFTVRIPV